MASRLARCVWSRCWLYVFFFQAEDGIRDWSVTGVQTCALPILMMELGQRVQRPPAATHLLLEWRAQREPLVVGDDDGALVPVGFAPRRDDHQIRVRDRKSVV